MPDGPVEFRELVGAHIRFRMGVFIGDVREIGGVPFILSLRANEPMLNRAFVFDAAPGDWPMEAFRAHAQANRRPLTVASSLAGDDPALAGLAGFARQQERWMLADLRRAPKTPDPKTPTPETPTPGRLAFRDDAGALDDFLDVFANMYDDARLNRFFMSRYAPPLIEAAARPASADGPRARRIVAYDAGAPVSCASVHIEGRLAGLYDVGTKHGLQRGGHGAAISRRAMAQARAEGADFMLLQCVVGTHTERLYARLGFETARVLTLLTER